MMTVNDTILNQLDALILKIEDKHQADVIAINSAIFWGVDDIVRDIIEKRKNRNKLAIILNTPGGLVEVVSRIVDIIRHHYHQVDFFIPDRAMSAGTILAMSGDNIYMDYFSCLGPIDPQIFKDGRFMPALSYLSKLEEIQQRAIAGQITAVDMELIKRMDLAELHSYEQARDLSIDLLELWLSKYKFANWTETETQKIPVTDIMKSTRAKEIATLLNDHTRWHSHGFGINLQTLQNEVKLRVEDLGEHPILLEQVRSYFGFMANYMNRFSINNLIHSEGDLR